MYLLGTATSLHHFARAPPKRSVGCGPSQSSPFRWKMVHLFF